MKTISNNLKAGDKLYYTDSKEYFGEITKVLKRDIHYKNFDGLIVTNYPLKFAVKMCINPQKSKQKSINN